MAGDLISGEDEEEEVVRSGARRSDARSQQTPSNCSSKLAYAAERRNSGNNWEKDEGRKP